MCTYCCCAPPNEIIDKRIQHNYLSLYNNYDVEDIFMKPFDCIRLSIDMFITKTMRQDIEERRDIDICFT